MENRNDWLIDYYALFGIAENASQADIKRAYRELVKAYHPDMYWANPHLRYKAEALMRLINQAYSILSNPLRRQHYDQLLHAQHQAAFVPLHHNTPDSSGPSFWAKKSWFESLLDWIERRRAEAPHRPLLSVGRKLWLFPLPFFLATGASSLFWNLGQLVNAPFLGGVTAVLAYLLLLVTILGRLLLPIRHQTPLTPIERILAIPTLGMILIVAGWLWIALMDHGGRGSNLWDLCWWCGLISFACASIAYL